MVHLVNLILNRAGIHVSDMASHCEVHERTIYRDMGALSRMGIPIYYNNGYRVMRDTASPMVSVSHLDLDLLCFAVSNSTLTRSPYFRSRLKIIVEKLQASKRRRSPSKEPDLVVYDRKSKTIPTHSSNPVILDFLKASLEHRWIVIWGHDGDEKRLTCIPVAVKFVDDRAHFVIARNEKSSWEMVPITKWLRVRLARDSFAHRPQNKG